jgi:hypothetical protein
MITIALPWCLLRLCAESCPYPRHKDFMSLPAFPVQSQTGRLHQYPCITSLRLTLISASRGKKSICTTRLWLRLRIMIRASRLLGVPSTTSTSTNEIGKVPLDTITQRRLRPTSFPFVYKHTNDSIVAYRTVFSRYLGVSELEVRLKYHDDSVSDG